MKTFRVLFNDEMVRAIVQGRKIVTRRPVKWRDVPPVGPGPIGGATWPCAPGDLMIGRECFQMEVPGCGHQGGVAYRADHNDPRGDGPAHPMRWRPSIHMPDWASRIRRTVAAVSVERLHDATDEDAVREGFGPREEMEELFRNCAPPGSRMQTSRERFADAWDSIYATKGLGWSVNPWVWRIEFDAAPLGRAGVPCVSDLDAKRRAAAQACPRLIGISSPRSALRRR